MKKLRESQIIGIGLAIFSMLFGAGNVYIPVMAGYGTSQVFSMGMLGFLIAAVGLPLLGLVAIILFDGDYRAFFQRTGVGTGNFLVFMSMLIIGPLVAMPRIVTVAHIMLAPFLPIPFDYLPIFSLVFLAITFIGAFKESRIVDLLGYVITPILLSALSFIIIKAVWFPADPIVTDLTASSAFWRNFQEGFGTLDLFGTIFFGSIVLSVLKQNNKTTSQHNLNKLAITALKGGVIGCGLLGIVYFGLMLLGMLHAHLFVGVVIEEAMFREIALMAVGGSGATVLGIAVLMACFSTAIALAAVSSEYLQRELKNHLAYGPALAITVLLTYAFSTLGIDGIMKYMVPPIATIGYPVVITVTLANLAYKLWGFKPIKTPVYIVAIITTSCYLYQLMS